MFFSDTAVKGKFCNFALLPLLLLTACAAGEQQSSGRPLQTVSAAVESDAVARFEAPAQSSDSAVTAQILSRAAFITLERRYKYFLLLPAGDSGHAGSPRPNLGIAYGRQPNGLGDAGASGFNGAPCLSLNSSFSFSQKAQPEQKEWAVYMMRQDNRQAVEALPLDKALLGNAAYIYNARAVTRLGDVAPTMLPLR